MDCETKQAAYCKTKERNQRVAQNESRSVSCEYIVV